MVRSAEEFVGGVDHDSAGAGDADCAAELDVAAGAEAGDVGATVEQGGEFAAGVGDHAGEDGAAFHRPDFEGVYPAGHGGPAVAGQYGDRDNAPGLGGPVMAAGCRLSRGGLGVPVGAGLMVVQDLEAGG